MDRAHDSARRELTFHEGDRIRKARELLEMKQGDLADATGLSRASISNYETGAPVKRSSRKLLSLALGVSAHWLETGEFEDGEQPHPFDRGPAVLATGASINSGCRSRRRILPFVAAADNSHLASAA